MCGRYFIDAEADGPIVSVIDELNRRDPDADVKVSGEVFPTDVVPVVARSRRGTLRLFAMRWGYALKNGRSVINARSETAAERPMFENGMRERRLLVPASGYFEWLHGERTKEKYAVRMQKGEPVFMAGIYRHEQDGPRFVILTRAPSEAVAFLHDRMPVILAGDAARDWLDPEKDAETVLRSAALAVSAKAAP